MKQAKTFVHEVKQNIPHFKIIHILNADQSSFNYEEFSTRTLSTSDERSTVDRITSSKAFTHSRTIMPIINIAGNVVGLVFICSQEPLGRLGPRVVQSMHKARNIHVTCSKSGN
ncbi:unnamed protein product [Rotaria sp. Silwood2]|nr:unnamed protein product [Rotaria sp. Silwood2]CAF3085687.1 unnamed protein product [Rotaria sp. Silwood2]CAF3401140.1 unnamed protein product [Rotaria sp. Silwood2]CAF4255343.1 unnamed protein product [Rotaria sp. Silwood2]CAF4345272.1 unnamed protein product [Rotaria sp. Silwood2]